LKIIVVAILAGGAFVFCLRELRRDEIAISTGLGRSRFFQLGLAALVIGVIAVIGVGFWFAGSPMKARLLAQDAQRVQDLAAICRSVEQYYSSKRHLPESLTVCDNNPGTFVRQKPARVPSRHINICRLMRLISRLAPILRCPTSRAEANMHHKRIRDSGSMVRD
jgi:hypothetical protein